MPPIIKGDVLPEWIPTDPPWFWGILTGRGEGSAIGQFFKNPVGWLAKTIAKWFVSGILWVVSYLLAAVGIPLQVVVRTIYTVTGALLGVGRTVGAVPIDVLWDVNRSVATTIAANTGLGAPLAAMALVFLEFMLLFALLDWALNYAIGIDLDGIVRRLRTIR